LLNRARQEAAHARSDAQRVCELIDLTRKELLRVLRSDPAFAASLPKEEAGELPFDDPQRIVP
jgi:hypothetical protein